MSDKRKKGLPAKVRMRHDQHFVEELTQRHETPVGRMVPISSVAPDPSQPRSAMGDLSELVGSVREKGILEPILVRRAAARLDEEPDAELVIISGERRFRAALEAGLYEIPVIEMDVDEREALEIALVENLQRKDLTPFEEAQGYQLLADSYGYTHEQISTAVGKSRTVVTESLALLQMPPRVRDAVQALGIQSKSILLEILKADSEEDMVRLAEAVATQGLKRADLRDKMRRPRDGQQARKPYVFKFKAPDKSYSLSLSFRQSTVEKDDLIAALSRILEELRGSQDEAF